MAFHLRLCITSHTLHTHAGLGFSKSLVSVETANQKETGRLHRFLKEMHIGQDRGDICVESNSIKAGLKTRTGETHISPAKTSILGFSFGFLVVQTKHWLVFVNGGGCRSFLIDIILFTTRDPVWNVMMQPLHTPIYHYRWQQWKPVNGQQNGLPRGN